MATRYTSADVARKVERINMSLRHAGKPDMLVQSTNPDGAMRRYEFAGWVYMGAGEACRALDAMIWMLNEIWIGDRKRKYVARGIDLARGDSVAAALLSPTERDELLRHFGGRYEG